MLKHAKQCFAFICAFGMLISISGCTKGNKVDITGYYLDGFFLAEESIISMGDNVEKDGIDDGDRIMVTFDGRILESYPERFGEIFDIELKAKGEVEDIPETYYKGYQAYLDYVEDIKQE